MDHVDQMPAPLQQHIRPAKGNRHKPGQEPAEPRAETQRAEPLEPPQVEIGAAVDTVERLGQPAVGPQQCVAAEETEPAANGLPEPTQPGRQFAAQPSWKDLRGVSQHRGDKQRHPSQAEAQPPAEGTGRNRRPRLLRPGGCTRGPPRSGMSGSFRLFRDRASRRSPITRKPRSATRSSSSSTSFRRATRSGRFFGVSPTSSSVADKSGRKRSRNRTSARASAARKRTESWRRWLSETRIWASLPTALRRCLHIEHVALAGERPLDAGSPERQGPLHHVDRVDVPLVIDADLLEVVEQPRLGRPDAARGLDRQGQEHFLPAADGPRRGCPGRPGDVAPGG